MSNLLEQKDYLELRKVNLWKAFFAGKKNRKMMIDIDHLNEEIKKINDFLYPRKKNNG